MYKTIITLRDDISKENLSSFYSLCGDAFDNRAGKLKNISSDPFKLVFEGGDKHYGCLQLGIFTLYREKALIKQLSSWEWIDDEPGESCDILHELSVPVS